MIAFRICAKKDNLVLKCYCIRLTASYYPLLGCDPISIIIARNPYYMGKDGNNVLSSCGSISIVLEVISNLNTTKGRASAKELCIARGQRQALEICSLVKG